MIKIVGVVIAILMLICFSSCTVEEPCTEFVEKFDVDGYINHGELQIIYKACRYNRVGNYECIMISEEDYLRWTNESLSTTCWQDAEDSI